VPRPADARTAQPWLRQRLDGLVADGTRFAKLAVFVAEADTGKTLFAYEPKRPMNIASNVKLMTTAAALAQLGPEYRFKTVVTTDEPRGSDAELGGDLILRGYGDPSLRVEDLGSLAAALAARGLRRVGGVTVDDSFFDEARWGPGFEQKGEDGYWRAPNGATSIESNTYTLTVQPGAAEGAPARIILDPPSSYLQVKNGVRTTARGRSALTVEAVSQAGAGHSDDVMVVQVSGRIRTDDPGRSFRRRVEHPARYAGATFIDALRRYGIRVARRSVRLATAAATTRTLATHLSEPLSVLIREVNKRSNNFMAEQLVKSVGAEVGGAPGSWAKGLDAIARYLDGIGVLRTQYVMKNGSGLYDSSRFTPEQVAVLLRAAYRDFRYSADFLSSLAVAGTDGTIGHRLGGSQAERYVRAKTGTLAAVSCLSGYAGFPAKPPLVFSILMNDVTEESVLQARQLQDDLVQALLAYLEIL
jgi:D-alanyl-D-alanine carboxypeptidase/D-alanyl-D-alanine-endopeptidase (penicillin-binding protein 4)